MEIMEFGGISENDLMTNVLLTNNDMERIIEDIDIDIDEAIASLPPERTTIQLLTPLENFPSLQSSVVPLSHNRTYYYQRGDSQTFVEIPLRMDPDHLEPLPHPHFCTTCSIHYTEREAYDLHMYTIHGKNDFAGKIFSAASNIEDYTVSYFPSKMQCSYCQQSWAEQNDIKVIFQCLNEQFYQDISSGLKLFKRMGLKFSLYTNLLSISMCLDEVKPLDLITSNFYVVLIEGQIERTLEILAGELFERIQNLRAQGYYLDVMKSLRMSIFNYNCFSRSSYLPLPYVLWKRRELFLNVDNSLKTYENESLTSSQEKFRRESDIHSSFLFAVAAGIKNAKYCTESMKTYRKIMRRFNLEGIVLPMTLEQIPKFERQNPFLEISVFGFNDTGINELNHPDKFPQNVAGDDVYEKSKKSMARCHARDKIISKFSLPLYASRAGKIWGKYGSNGKICSRKFNSNNKDNLIKIDLFLLIRNQPDEAGDVNITEHYVLCKDVGSLFRRSNRCKSYLCRQCLQRFKNPETLGNHVNRCAGTKAQFTEIYFENEKKTCLASFA